jgi:(E)-4-hydroxy-3-methylbut-2-enyl-diphosphate synthase
MIACPTCGRVEVDLFAIANEIDAFLAKVDEPIRVAVMGCVVNGPGEARDADVGLAGGNSKGIIFRKGKIVKTVPEDEMVAALKTEIMLVIEERQNGTYVDTSEASNRYQPMIKLTSVS